MYTKIGNGSSAMTGQEIFNAVVTPRLATNTTLRCLEFYTYTHVRGVLAPSDEYIYQIFSNTTDIGSIIICAPKNTRVSSDTENTKSITTHAMGVTSLFDVRYTNTHRC
jgi:hypothetical protein